MAEAIESELPSVRLQRESTAEQVATALRELIIAGTIGAGTHLSEGPVSQQLGVSRNTIREALQILVSQGLVRREIHRGAYVSELDADDVRDLFRVRRLIELAAIREFARSRMDASNLEPRLAQIAAAESNVDVLNAELRLWQTVVEMVESERFVGLHAATISELQLSVALAGTGDIDQKAIVRKLRSIVAALRRGDPDRAATLMAERLAEDASEHLSRISG